MCSQRDKEVLNMILNPNLPFGQTSENKKEEGNEEVFSSLPNYEESERANIEGVKLAERGDFDGAMEKFCKAIELCPENPSPYNNRAQLHRLQAKIPEALADLERALALSNGRGKIAAQSHVQRGLVFRLDGEEEKAKEEFENAAKLGSTFAQNQLVAMNPYAAMCNKMLTEMMTKFRSGEE